MLVGRAPHVQRIRAHIDALSDARGHLLLIAGEAGIGKTRLAEEAMDIAASAGVETRRVTCWAEMGAPPFWPWSKLLTDLGETPLADPPDAADPGVGRFAFFASVAETLQAIGRRGPRVLVLDDLHWADAPSVRLLAYLAPLVRDMPVLLVGTYRDDEMNGSSDLHTVLPDLVRHGRQIVVPPLDRAELGEFVGGLGAGALDAEAIGRLHAVTAGNPLFAREVVSLLDAGALDLGAPDELPLPETVRATLTRRLDSVSIECRDALGVASVIGVEFSVAIVAEVAALDPSELLSRLDEAETARLVRRTEPGRFAFTHPLIRETAYRDLGLARRVRLHDDVGAALERTLANGAAVDPAELAHHYLQAAPGGRASQALYYSELAGTRAMALLAYEAAVSHFEHALESLALCPADVARRTELLLELGEARSASGDLPKARLAFDEAAVLALTNNWPDRLARAALGCGSGQGGFEVAPFDTAHIELLRVALERLPGTDTVTRSWLLARLSVAMAIEGSGDERLALSVEAVELARTAGDDRALAYALAAHCDAIPGAEWCEQRYEETTEIIALARARGDARMELLGRRLRMLALCELGRFSEADDEIDAYAHTSDAIRQPLYAWYPPLWRGMRALMQGDFDRARAWREDAEAMGASAHSENARMLTLSLELGERMFSDEPQGVYERGRELVLEFPEIAFMMRPGLAMAAARCGQLIEARALVDGVRLDNPSTWGSEWLPGAVIAADAAARTGALETAAALYDMLLPFRHLYGVDGIGACCYGSVEQPLAMLAAALGRAEESRDHFAAALAAHRAAGARTLVEQTERAIAWSARHSTGGARPVAEAARAGEMRREDSMWTLVYEGRTARLRDSKGIGDIARLVAEPGREIHVLDLAGAGRAVTGDAGPRLDDAARDAYKARLRDLEQEIEAADAAADVARSERLAAEREALLAELAGAYGLGGRTRKAGDPAERARSAVAQRVRDALGRIDAEHPPLGRHLRRSLRTGLYCVYEPDGPVEWKITISQP